MLLLPATSTPAESAAARAPQEPGRQMVGSSGLPLQSGRPQGYEPNVSLDERTWWAERVPRLAVCPPVDLGTEILTGLMLSAPVQVEGGRPDARRLIQRQWGLEDAGRPPGDLWSDWPAWESRSRRFLRAAFTGAGAHEWVAEVADDGYVYVSDMAEREMSSIVGFRVDARERLTHLRQQVVGWGSGFGTNDIPISQLFFLRYRPRGETDMRGHGLWRAIDAEAKSFASLGNLLDIGARRFAVGEVLARVNLEKANALGAVTGNQNDWVEAQNALISRWLRDRTASVPEGASLPPWVDVEIIGGKSGYDPMGLVAQRAAAAENVLQQLQSAFVMTGGTQATGGYNSAKVTADQAVVAAQNILDWMLGELDRQVNAPVLRANFPGMPPEAFPRMKSSGLVAPVFVEKFAELVQAANTGLIRGTAADEDAIRKALGLPPRDPNAPIQTTASAAPVAPIRQGMSN